MLLSEWHIYFDILQDKYGSQYFTVSEKETLFNRAILDFVNSHFTPNKKGVTEAERNQRISENLQPLTYRVPAINMDPTGLITNSQIETSLQTIVASGQFMRLLALGWEQSDSYSPPIKFTRHNDWYQFKRNYFKDPKRAGVPKYYTDGLNYFIQPINTIVSIRPTVIKYPAIVSSVGPVECDLPDFTHNIVLASALSLAGVSSRDEALSQLLALQQGKFDSARYEV